MGSLAYTILQMKTHFLPKDFIWSPSRINTLWECPRKFYYQYIAGEKGLEERNEPAELGKAVHELIEQYITKRELNVVSVAEKYDLSSESRIDLLGMVDNIKLFTDKKLASLKGVKKVLTEIEVKHRNIRGIVDLLVELSNNHFLIVDHKTTKKKFHKDTVPSDYLRQILIYSYLVAKSFPEVKYLSTAFFLVRNGETVKVHIAKPAEEIVSKAEEVLKKTQNLLLQVKDNWPPNPSWRCNFCPYRQSCGAFVGG